MTTTVLVDLLLLNKFVSYGCFSFFKGEEYAKGECEITWHLGIEAFLELIGFLNALALIILLLVLGVSYMIAKFTVLKKEDNEARTKTLKIWKIVTLVVAGVLVLPITIICLVAAVKAF